MHYQEPATCYQVVCSGFFDSVGLYRRPSADQRRAARQSMARLGTGDLARKDFTNVSAGQQRMVLLARALVKDPPLLVLDEPCQGLDAANRRRIRRAVDQACVPADRTLIHVTHHVEDLPDCITHVLKLRNGRAAHKGAR